MDGLKAINVYVIETDDGLTLIDGGWAIEVARELLERCLRDVGYGFGDIRRFLVTHIHRDHYTLATVLGQEYGATSRSAAARSRASTLLNDLETLDREPVRRALLTAGARTTSPRSGSRGDERRRAARPGAGGPSRTPGSTATTRSRSARARSTPCTRRGTRPGTTCSPTGPTGCCSPATTCCRRSRRRSASRCRPTPQPLGDFMASLTKVRVAARPADPARARPGRAVLARPGRRAARAPRGRGSTCASTRSPPAPATASDVAAHAAVDPARARLRRPRRVQPRAWPRWRPRRTSSCWWPAVTRRARGRRGRRRLYSAALEAHRRCGMPSSRNSSPVTSNPNAGVPRHQRSLASSTTSRSGQTCSAVSISRSAQPLAAHRRAQRHPADPPGVAVVERPARSRARRRARPRARTCRVPGWWSRPSRSG